MVCLTVALAFGGGIVVVADVFQFFIDLPSLIAQFCQFVQTEDEKIFLGVESRIMRIICRTVNY
jgi:hypothetical protein